MPNSNAPFGFSPEGTVGGSTPNFRLSTRLISASNTTPIFKGDAVVPVSGPTTGYIQQATAGAVALAGIFWGCEYLSISQGKKIWSNMWPGADANGDVQALVIDDPQIVLAVQAGATAIGMASLNQNVQLSVGTGNTTTQLSGMFIQNPANTATLPFTIVGFITSPTGAPGTDITSPFNWVLVTFNNQIFRAGLTSVS